MLKFLAAFGLAACGASRVPPAAPAPAPHPSPSPSPPTAGPIETWLAPIAEDDVLPVVDFALDPAERTWTSVMPPQTLAWSGASRAQTGSDTWLCQRGPGSWLIGVQSQLGGTTKGQLDLVHYPALTLEADYGTRVRGTGYEDSVDCHRFEAYFDRERRELHMFDQLTNEDRIIAGHWPAANDFVLHGARVGQPWTIAWPEVAFEIDFAAARVAPIPVPDSLADRRMEPLPGYASCLRYTQLGHRTQMFCVDASNVSHQILRDPIAHTLQLVVPRPPVAFTYVPNTTDAWAVSPNKVDQVLDQVNGRYLRLAAGPMAIGQHTMNSRVLYGMSDSGLELRRYDLDAGTYQVLRRYAPGDCAGRIGNSLEVTLDAGRFVGVMCVVAIGRPKLMREGRLIWSELLDLQTNRIFRTPLAIEKVLPDGMILLADRKNYDSMWSPFRHIWAARL